MPISVLSSKDANIIWQWFSKKCNLSCPIQTSFKTFKKGLGFKKEVKQAWYQALTTRVNRFNRFNLKNKCFLKYFLCVATDVPLKKLQMLPKSGYKCSLKAITNVTLGGKSG